MEQQVDLLADVINESSTRRIKLIPVWIKIFAWIFLVIGCFVPIVFIMGIMGMNASLSLYGFETNEPLSVTGVIITLLFCVKTITAFGILKEKQWAVKLGLVDAVIGIAACIIAMIYPIFYVDSGIHFSLRLELVALIPYLIKLKNIKTQWESYRAE